MCHQDKEEIAENTTGHQSQQIKTAAAGVNCRNRSSSTAKATIRNNQMLNKRLKE